MARKPANDRATQQTAAMPALARRHWRLTLAPLALLTGGDLALDSTAFGPVWSAQQVGQLRHWAAATEDDALPRPDTRELDQAVAGGHPLAINRAASDLALRLGKLHLLGSTPQARRLAWHIVDTDNREPLADGLAGALMEDRLDSFLSGLRPAHPHYAALRTALAQEADPARRMAIARTMERWRWLPRDMGHEYVLANAAGFEVTLWRDGKFVKRWAAIAGKTGTPTPSLMAEAVAVNFNPWWEVPASIARESNMRAGGRYVWNGKRFRQPPGPGNALGQMKLVMPNPYNIYLHDTPSKSQFTAEMRAFSHGCMRVEGALDLAQILLDGTRSAEQIERIVNPKPAAPGLKAEPKSTVVALPHKVPVYVIYQTVTVKPDGALAFHKDIYGRDGAIAVTLPGVPAPEAAAPTSR